MPHPHPHPQPRHGWIEYDRKDSSREEFGAEVEELGKLIAENSEITFGDARIALPENLTFEAVFERNPHGNFVLRIHAEWPEYEPSRRTIAGRTPRFGASPRNTGAA